MPISELSDVMLQAEKPANVSLCLAAGRKDKLRPGDILGALTSPGGIAGSAVGKIEVLDYAAYVAVQRDQARAALNHLQKKCTSGRWIKVSKSFV